MTDTVKKYTNQTAFTAAATHLLRQNEVSVEPGIDGLCMYRGPEGRKCALGALIPDELYRPSFEGKSLRAVCDQSPEVALLFEDCDHTLMARLQLLHDSEAVHAWPSALAILAEDFREELLESK